jgi:hypothetical protein
VLRARSRRIGRGSRREVLVKWKGYNEPNWEPRSELEDNAALDEFEERFGTGDDVGEEEGAYTGSGKRGRRGRRPAKASSQGEEGGNVMGLAPLCRHRSSDALPGLRGGL